MKIISMIPARYSASRFPGKLMEDLNGESVILRTYHATQATNLFDDVFVVTDSEIIFNEIVNHGGKAIMSKKEHECGSDRIAEAVEFMDVDIVVNVQGDEPFTEVESLRKLINVFKEKGYQHGAAYLENLSQRIFTNIEIWLKTGVIAPKTISLLERIFREIGRRIKRIAWGWSDATVSKLSNMIILKKYSKEKWEKYWKQKLGIKGHFSISIQSAKCCPCHNF